MQLFGPALVAYLPEIPPGVMHMTTPWFVEVWQLPIFGTSADRWSLAELTEPTDLEWIELAFRLGIPFTEFECAVARANERTDVTIQLPTGEVVPREAALRWLVEQSRRRCTALLPAGQAYAVDTLGIIGRVTRVRWEE